MVILKADNRVLLDGAKITYLTQNYTSGTSSIVVSSGIGFTTDQFVLFGDFGTESSEIIKVSGVVSNTIALSTTTKSAHSESTRITIIPYNQVAYYWTATAVFSSGTPLGLGPIDIQADDLFTKYTDSVHSTGFGWFKFYNSNDVGTYTTESNAIPYGDFSENSVKKLLDSFYSSLNNREMNLITMDDALRYMNEGISRATNHLNLVSNEYNVESSTITTAAGTAEYDLPTYFGDLISISDSSGISVNHVDIWDVNYWNANASNTSKYYIRNKKIGFSPVPTGVTTYALYYKDISSALSSLYDNLDFPDNNFYCIVDFMLYRACPKLGRTQVEAVGYFNAFNAGVDLMKVTSIKQSANLDRWTIDKKYNV